MDALFLDTSALVKRYLRETGSKWMKEQCDPQLGRLIHISQATLVEAVAALCRRAREQNTALRISQKERDEQIEIFRGDVQTQYGVFTTTDSLYTDAGNLCKKHQLRVYDAIQLTCALASRTALLSIGKVFPCSSSCHAAASFEINIRRGMREILAEEMKATPHHPQPTQSLASGLPPRRAEASPSAPQLPRLPSSTPLGSRHHAECCVKGVLDRLGNVQLHKKRDGVSAPFP